MEYVKKVRTSANLERPDQVSDKFFNKCKEIFDTCSTDPVDRMFGFEKFLNSAFDDEDRNTRDAIVSLVYPIAADEMTVCHPESDHAEFIRNVAYYWGCHIRDRAKEFMRKKLA